MRIGIMLRTLDESGGIAMYTRNLVQELLCIDRANEYVLFYRTPNHIGRFGRYDNVSERWVKAPNKALWDQVMIPYACWREGVDLVFHPKFTVPLLAPCKKVMVVHGADWFIPGQAQYYDRLDKAYIKLTMPVYFRTADLVISVSELTTQNFREILGVSAEKIKTIYFAPARHFKREEDPERTRRRRPPGARASNGKMTLRGLSRLERATGSPRSSS